MTPYAYYVMARDAAKAGDWKRFDELRIYMVRSDVTLLERKFNRDANRSDDAKGSV